MFRPSLPIVTVRVVVTDVPVLLVLAPQAILFGLLRALPRLAMPALPTLAYRQEQEQDTRDDDEQREELEHA